MYFYHFYFDVITQVFLVVVFRIDSDFGLTVKHQIPLISYVNKWIKNFNLELVLVSKLEL